MKQFISLSIIVFIMLFTGSAQTSFKQQQQKYPRVRQAYKDKETLLKNKLSEKGIDNFNNDIYIRAFKNERILEVWIKPESASVYQLLIEYKFCASSGRLGPKRKQGDGQIPEGFYHIDRFNPYSNFYLSLGINYPNASDKKLGNANPGGDIFIHGNCVTIGCIPITDDCIKELYLLAVEAKNHGQTKIPVHIFPARLSDKNHQKLIEQNKEKDMLVQFWKELKPAYDYFENNRKVPNIKISSSGKYLIN